MSFFHYDFDIDFEILFETRKDWMLVKRLNLINYIIILKRSLLLIDFDDNSSVKLSKIIMLSNKYIDT